MKHTAVSILHCCYPVFVHTDMYGYTYSKSMNQPGKVANPARGQLYIDSPVLGCLFSII